MRSDHHGLRPPAEGEVYVEFRILGILSRASISSLLLVYTETAQSLYKRRLW